MARVLKAVELRQVVYGLYPDFEDGREDNEPYDHAMTAVGVVLLSGAICGTDETPLALFTGYSCRFISAIAWNMRNNYLWGGHRYDVSAWLSADGTINSEHFLDHIDFACGSSWLANTETDTSTDPRQIYWDEREPFCKRYLKQLFRKNRI